MKRQWILISFLACLIALKFIVVPLNEVNEELGASVTAKQIRLVKGRNILDSKEKVETGLTKIRDLLSAYRSQFPVMDSPEKGRLEIQRRISSLAREFNVEVESAQWVGASDGNPVHSELDIQFSSSLNDAVKWHIEMARIGTWISVENIEFSTSNQNLRIKRQGTVSGTLLVKVLFLTRESEQ